VTGPRVECQPGMRFGQPHVGGISVGMLAGQVWAGSGVDTIAADYGLERGQVLVACWYAARYGTGLGPADTRRWKQRWAGWATAAETVVRRGDWDDVPDPPDSEGGGS